MITITARCQTCSWKWRPRKAEGPDSDYNRAKNAAAVHRRQNPRHVVRSEIIEKRKLSAGTMVSGRVEVIGG